MAFLAIAFGFLIWGQTVLKVKLQGVSFVLYWSACFLFTFLALMTALVDIWCVRRRIRKERRKLLKDAFVKMQDGDDHGGNSPQSGASKEN